jgi:tRNA-Thr(GGU) m(6)t(6)A37 methyltransferase TsaA
MTLQPIGIFQSDSTHPYEARRQATALGTSSGGQIVLRPNQGFEQALEDLEGFERIWIIYQFHQNRDWKPKVMPPRGPRIKRGVFATRAPYRPNPIGLSCVRLVKVTGLTLVVEGNDLLDGTPILDIKPYLPYADAFPESKVGWLENVEEERWQIEFSEMAVRHIQWLNARGLTQLMGFLTGQLEFDPLDHKRKRVDVRKNGYCLAYRTWRADFSADLSKRQIQVLSISSGYTEGEMSSIDDPHGDKDLHRQFTITYGLRARDD